MNYINLGCGGRFLEDWQNFDFVSNSKFVIPCNLTQGIPLEDNIADVIYHSHVLEHFSKFDGENFLKENYRVLKEKGIIRIVIPDLEQIALSYITALNDTQKNKTNLNEARYNWAITELLDQMVREKSGGEMLKIWGQDKLINEDQIIERVGDEFKKARKNILTFKNKTTVLKNPSTSFKSRVKNFFLRKLNINLTDLATSNFRNSGEIHKWMYDKYSITKLLENIGFKEINITNAFKSKIPNWETYLFLDVENQRVRKPDSLFIEAIK